MVPATRRDRMGNLFEHTTQAGVKKADSVFQSSAYIFWSDVDPLASSLRGSKVLRGFSALFSKIQEAANQRTLWSHQGVGRYYMYHHPPTPALHGFLLLGALQFSMSGDLGG